MIDETLTYFENNQKALIDDVIFGVLLARSNLQWIFNEVQSRFDFDKSKNKIDILLEKCDKILENRNNHSCE